MTVASANDALICTVNGPTAGSELIYEEGYAAAWQPWGSWGGTSANDRAVVSGQTGSYSLQLTFARAWGGIELKRAFPISTVGKKAIVFRVRGIKNTTELGQIQIATRDEYDTVIGWTYVTNHMITPDTNGGYDPAKWYTVVMSLTSLDLVGRKLGSIAFMTGELLDVYLDDIWLVQGLEFPLNGQTANTAWITSVFDHAMTDVNGVIKPFAIDNVVTAYTGDVGKDTGHTGDSTCRQGPVTSFGTIMANYTGVSLYGGVNYLCYDGHPAVDYNAALETPIRSPGTGVITFSDCAAKSTRTSCAGLGSTWGKLEIDLVGPYKVSFNHLSFVEDGIYVGKKVKTGDLVGYVGHTAPVNLPDHLHIGILLDYGADMFVDPYGWTHITKSDPYRVKAVNVPLWN
jgi:murein DD-endopeptidase MepM/ murein hydrolase activator NlpD